MIKTLVLVSVGLFSSIGFAAQTKTCSFPAMQNVPVAISIDGSNATIVVQGSPLNKCTVASKAEVTALNEELVKKANKIGPIVDALRCRDAQALSSYEIYFTPSSQVYFYMETQGLISGTCK